MTLRSPLRMRAAALVAALALPAAAPLRAQVATLDEGSFTISRNGQAVGREEFVIRSTPGTAGAQYVASATVTFADLRLAPALNTDANGVPSRYQVEMRTAEGRDFLSGTVGRGRFSSRLQTPRGESAGEYLVGDGALLLDDDVFHQYFFVGREAPRDSVRISAIVPRRNTQVSLRVVRVGSGSVTIGSGAALPALHLRLLEPAGAARELWVDDRGRVLRVEIPARGVVALRDDPPK